MALAWTVATLAAVFIAAAAVGSVRTQVTDAPSAPVRTVATSLTAASSPSESPAAPAGAPSEDETIALGGPPVFESDSADGDVPTTTMLDVEEDGGTSGTKSPAATSTTTSTTPSDVAVATTTTEAPDDDSDTPTTAATQGVSRQTFDLIGGTVVVEVGQGTVVFVGASPRDGFTVEVDERGPERVVVKFESEAHTSKFVALFEDGTFAPKIEEGDRDDD